jgi:autotransporter adhesin
MLPATGSSRPPPGDGEAGVGASATGFNATAAGELAEASADGSTALGAGAQATAESSIALGAGSVADRENTVSVGSAGNERQIVHVAAGELSEDSTDAVNGSQLFETNERVTAVEGRVDDLDGRVGDVEAIATNAVVYDDADKGTITLAGADGTVITNVAAGELSEDSTDAVNGSQLFETNERVAVVEGRVDDLDTRIGDIEDVAGNAVQYDDSSKDSVTFGGADGTRLGNVAAGAVTTDSMDAINGGQLYAALDSVAGALGGGVTVTALGTLSALAYQVQGANYFSVGEALGALDSQISLLGSRLAVVEAGDGNSANGRVAVGGQPDGGDDAVIGAGTDAVAIGSNATANASNGVAVGSHAYAHGPNDTAVGGNARVLADGSTAVGANTLVSADATNAVAMGEGARVTAASGTAVGQGASVTAEGAVALGQGSVADRANTVSVGSAGNERQITNVAAGTQATDAVNVAQLDARATQAVADAKAYTDMKFDAWADSFRAYQDELERRFTDQDRRIDRQGAMGAAMLNMATSAAGIRTQNRVGVGIGFQGGESALSIGYQRALSDRATLTIGGAFSGDEKSVGLGAGFGW